MQCLSRRRHSSSGRHECREWSPPPPMSAPYPPFGRARPGQAAALGVEVLFLLLPGRGRGHGPRHGPRHGRGRDRDGLRWPTSLQHSSCECQLGAGWGVTTSQCHHHPTIYAPAPPRHAPPPPRAATSGVLSCVRKSVLPPACCCRDGSRSVGRGGLASSRTAWVTPRQMIQHPGRPASWHKVNLSEKFLSHNLLHRHNPLFSTFLPTR